MGQTGGNFKRRRRFAAWHGSAKRIAGAGEATVLHREFFSGFTSWSIDVFERR
ncbi:Hypothetical protein Cul210932_1693 [Corynebacterium ulcerans]|uniref:Uncharacterized protein n=1 Tax=Corynebacterium ulcerans FRC58 TaxID=1408268 RepID=A0ABM5U287_CORUL|nr:Hypothetical protein Cul210932_1693 [Corynebacterium ulcerans]AKN77585.1 Hypothetical protein CulFRC58_1731 [Corynebacterium ulcerans FRC58]ALD95414.1 Hypothetical protein Cul131001_1721 [Corynebacterium ulcerans]